MDLLGPSREKGDHGIRLHNRVLNIVMQDRDRWNTPGSFSEEGRQCWAVAQNRKTR
jgi:hypothetical protein